MNDSKKIWTTSIPGSSCGCIVLLLAGCAFLVIFGLWIPRWKERQVAFSQEASATPSEVLTRKEHELEAENLVLIADSAARYANGTIRNPLDRALSYVRVDINLYDKDDLQVGSTFTNVTNLEAGGTWKFEAPILESKATKFKVTKIASW